MSYYPILKGPGCDGWTTLCNFAPNNWEFSGKKDKFIYVSWVNENSWNSKCLGTLKYNDMRTVRAVDYENIIPADVLPFLSMSTKELTVDDGNLPFEDNFKTTIPEWRSTLGLSSALSSVSYQGEINPFPSHGSLLTFSPFLQFGDDIENYMIFLNLEKSASPRSANIEIFNSESIELLKLVRVENNNANIISLDNLGFMQDDLPLIICREMAGIPLYFSKTKDGRHLSMEHTHPPASYVIHGKRFIAQKLLKDIWFSKTQKR